MQTLRANGSVKARQGITTADEVLRVTQDDRDGLGFDTGTAP